MYEVAAQIAAQGAVGGGGGGMHAEGVEKAQIHVGGLPYRDASGGGNARHIQKSPVRGGHVDAVYGFQVHRLDHLLRILQMRADEDRGFLLEAAVVVPVVLGDGIFKDDIVGLDLASQFQRLLDGVEMMAGVQDNAQFRCGLVHGVYALGHIAILQSAFDFDAVESLCGGPAWAPK